MPRTKPDFSDLLPSLPPLIAREKVGEYTGGVLMPSAMRNLDYKGAGPKRIRIGRKVAYRSTDLIEWLEERAQELI